MKIAVLGRGNVGGTLGRRWAEAGHEVTFGVLEVRTDDEAPLDRAVEDAEVVVFALPYGQLVPVGKSLGLEGKILVDCTNPIAPDFTGLIAMESSAAEELTTATGSPRVVKCFNTVGFNVMADPDFDGRPVSMLLCGDDLDAKAVVEKLASDLGFAPVDAGPLHQARWLEGMAWLWISMAMKHGHGREMAFIYERR